MASQILAEEEYLFERIRLTLEQLWPFSSPCGLWALIEIVTADIEEEIIDELLEGMDLPGKKGE